MSLSLPEHLDLIATAPGGIQKLRGLILELAVRGKLLPQDYNDEPASELLMRLATERSRLEADGICKKSKSIPNFDADEKPFSLPVNWEWARLGIISEKLTDGSHNPPHDAGSGLPMLSSQNVQDGWIDITNPSRYLSEQDFILEDSRTKIAQGDVLLTIVASIGRSAVVQAKHGQFALQRSVAVIQSKLVPAFLSLQLRAPPARRYYDMHAKGTAQKGIYLGKLGDMPIAVPPLTEQNRIVAKVDELMTLCDRLEAEQTDAASAHTRLVETLLGTLTQSNDAADLTANWQRLAEHFDTLFTTEASIEALKRTILQLAVMGKLVQQEPNDEPANELLKQIAAKRALMEAAGVWKKAKPLPAVADDERQHSIPRTWECVRLQEICSTITDGTHQTPKYTESGRPFLSAQNVKPFRFMPEFFRYVSEEDYQGYVKSSKPEFGDILLTRVGAMIGEAAVIDKQMDFAIYVSLALLKPCQPFVLPEFITLWLNSPFGTQSSIRDTLGRGVSAGNLNLSMIRAFAIPLPPTSEQKRIVAKVGELMLFCDSLKVDLIKARQQQARLATTLIETSLEAA